MKGLMMILLALVAGYAAGMTTEEFEKLYGAAEKGAEECWKLYEAYANGDGVEKSDTHARKWLLAAHRCGKEGAREALANLPWRKALKGKKGVKMASVDDETARAKGEELARLLQAWRKENNVTGISPTPVALPKDKMKQVRKLISEGADMNVVVQEADDTTLYTALSVACVCANADLAKLLIAAGADPCAAGMEALFVSMEPYNPIAPRVKAGQQVKPARNEKELERKVKRDKKKSDALDSAAAVTAQEQSSKKMIELLLKNGLDADMWNDYGWSAGTMAVVNASPLAADLLAKKGVKLNVPSRIEESVSGALSAKRMNYLVSMGFVSEGAMPIYVAVMNMDDAVVPVLLRNGADLSKPLNKKGLGVKEFVEEQEKMLSEKKDGNPQKLESAKRCIQLLKAAM